MNFSKQIGPMGISISDGKASVSLAVSQELGGGAVKGMVKASASAVVEVEAQELLDLGLDMLAAKLPALSAEIAFIKAALDAEAAKA